MAEAAQKPETMARGARNLRTALGPAVAGFLEDPMIVEVMLNPDGRLWIDRLSEGLSDTGATLSPADGERIVRLVAHQVGAEAHAARPRVSTELPETGERFEGLLPPVVTARCFAIRKPAVAVFTLADYVPSGIMAATQAQLLREAVAARANILAAGGTSTGKTTLTNALLAEVAGTSDRVVIIEDTRELQCAAPNLVALRWVVKDDPVFDALLTELAELTGFVPSGDRSAIDFMISEMHWTKALFSRYRAPNGGRDPPSRSPEENVPQDVEDQAHMIRNILAPALKLQQVGLT